MAEVPKVHGQAKGVLPAAPRAPSGRSGLTLVVAPAFPCADADARRTRVAELLLAAAARRASPADEDDLDAAAGGER